MNNIENHHEQQEVQKLIDKSHTQLNALYEYENESESSKDEVYLNVQQLHKNRNGSDSSDGSTSGYNAIDKSMDDIDEDSMAIFAEISQKLEMENTFYNDGDTQETPLNKCCNAFWNLLKYISIFLSIFWIIFLFVILIQPSMKTIHSIIYSIDPIAGQNHPVPHRVNSKASCSTYDMSKFAKSFNVYLIFHFLRWFVYSLIYRNRLILWINSILWELIQFFIASMIVFNLQWIGQCWYNSIVFDILFTNMCGIEFGYIIMKKTNTIELYNEFNNIFKCKISFYKSFICIWCTVIVFQLQQLLMFIIFDQTFWYDTQGWMIWIRLLIYELATLFCNHQLFDWIKSCKINKGIASLSWVVILNVLVLSELLIAIKTYSAQYHQ